MNDTPTPVETLLFAQHGWADDNRAMQRLGSALAQPGGRVIATKLGYVRTWLRIEPLIEIAERAAQEALSEHPEARIRVIGHSMGGLIWIELLTRHPEWLTRLDRLALIGCPVGGAELAGILDPFGLTIGRDLRVDRRARAEAVAEVVPTITIVGGLLGSHDGTVSHQSARLPNARFVQAPSASHATSRHSPWVTRLVRAFFEQPAPPAVDLEALIDQVSTIPGLHPTEPRLMHLAQVDLMLADGTTIRTLNGIPGLRIVFVADSAGHCVFAGSVPSSARDALEQTLAEIRAQYEPHLLP
jgi:pimeloyl-ACP methyl ester carboxylesterase